MVGHMCSFLPTLLRDICRWYILYVCKTPLCTKKPLCFLIWDSCYWNHLNPPQDPDPPLHKYKPGLAPFWSMWHKIQNRISHSFCSNLIPLLLARCSTSLACPWERDQRLLLRDPPPEPRLPRACLSQDPSCESRRAALRWPWPCAPRARGPWRLWSRPRDPSFEIANRAKETAVECSIWRSSTLSSHCWVKVKVGRRRSSNSRERDERLAFGERGENNLWMNSDCGDSTWKGVKRTNLVPWCHGLAIW